MELFKIFTFKYALLLQTFNTRLYIRLCGQSNIYILFHENKTSPFIYIRKPRTLGGLCFLDESLVPGGFFAPEL